MTMTHHDESTLAHRAEAQPLASSFALAFTPRNIDELRTLGEIAHKSGICKVSNPDAATILIATGLGLGMDPMQSLRSLHIVEGRVMIAADTMVALVMRSGTVESWAVTEKTEERCTIVAKRKGRPEITRSYSQEDVDRAGLNKPNGNHQKIPATMKHHRCCAIVCREEWPDVMLGMYAPDEDFGEQAPRSQTIPARETTVTVVRTQTSEPSPDFGAFASEIEAAATGDALTEIGGRVKASALPREKQRELAKLSQERRAALMAATENTSPA